jgi:hypothetical protein
MKKTLFTLFLLLNFSFSFSQEDGFTFFQIDGKKVEYYYFIEKSETISYNNKYVKVWIKNVFPLKTVKNKNGKYVKTGGDEIKCLISFICGESTYDMIYGIEYDKNGKVTHENKEEQNGNIFIPGTILYELKKELCK